MYNKDIGAKIFLIGIFVSSLASASFGIDANLGIRSLSLAVFILLLSGFIFFKEKQSALQLDLLTFIYLLYTAFSCLSILWSINTAEAFYTSSRVVLAFSVFVLAQHFLKKNNPEFETDLLKLITVLSLITILVTVLELAVLGSIQKSDLYQITGLNAHKNLLSSYLYLCLCFLIYAVSVQQNIWRILSITLIFPCLILIVLLQTKAVWVALLLSALIFGIVTFVVGRKLHLKGKHVIAVLIIFLVLSNLFFVKILPGTISRLLTKSASTQSTTEAGLREADEERLQLWQKSYHMITSHSVKGVGNGNWQTHFPDATLSGIWRAEDLNVTFQRPHNDFLWVLCENGIIGLNLFLVFIFLLLFQLLKSSEKDLEETKGTLPKALFFAAISGFVIISFFDFPKERIEHLILSNILFAFAHNHFKRFIEWAPAATFKLHLLTKSVMVFGLLVVVCLTGMHLKGEFYTRLLYDARNTQAIYQVISNADKARGCAYSVDPTSMPISWYEGNAYAEAGNFEAAEQAFEDAIKISPYNRNVLNDLASAYVKENRRDLAKALYTEAARISPRFDEPKLNLAALYILENRNEQALFWLNSIQHDSPRRANYYRVIELQKQGP